MNKSKATGKTLKAIDPATQPGALKPFGGSGSDTWNMQLANQVWNCLWTMNANEEQKKSQLRGTISGMIGKGARYVLTLSALSVAPCAPESPMRTPLPGRAHMTNPGAHEGERGEFNPIMGESEQS